MTDDATTAAEAALDDAVAWFNSQLDRTIPDHTEDGEHPDRATTAREWFVDVRGYEPETVEENRLGWAPAGAGAQLLRYLLDRGHDRDAVRGTGLFTEDLRPLWNGRYVFPYLGADGRAQYAIGRATGGLGGGDAGYDGHPEDFIAGKYAKLAHTKEYVHVSEPIYGLASLDRDTPVVITEGVADAVRAHEAGYACLSPVTTQFKEEHREQLVEILDGRDRRAYIVQDAERPIVECTDEVDGWEALGVEQYGEGVKGAARTAAFLADAGVDAYLAELPRLGLDKVDLDDYLGEWADDLGGVLAGAKPGEEHRAYEPTSVSRNTDDGGETSDLGGSGASNRGGDGADLDAEDVKEALGHISKTLSYDEWMQLGFSVHAWGGDDTGKEIFTEWSRKSPKWDQKESGDAIDWIWSNASAPESESDVSVGTLVARAIEGGWEAPNRNDGEEWRDDPREVSATVDVRRAWDAAGRVTPDEVADDRLDATADGDAFAAPGGDRVDVVRAVAIVEGLVDDAEETLDDQYPEAYALAREEYGAPLPRYYTTSDAVAEFDAVLDVIGEATYWDLDTDALATEETARDDDVGGDAVRALNPAWRDSKSGESVLVYPSGTIWDADTERVLDVVRFAALDAGIVGDPTDPVKEGDFTDAYRAARETYGAPLPRWEPAVDGAREITAQLPPAEELVEARDLDGVDRDLLDEAREDVETLLREATTDTDEPTVVRALPATGKTTGTVKTAADRAVSYLAPRKELQQQAIDKAERWGVDARLLPVFSEARVDDAILSSAVSHVREHGKDRLRDRWAVLLHALDEEGDDVDAEALFTDDEADEDDDEVDLDRATCPTAEGEYGPDWALAVHVARALGYTPREIHTEAEGLFGAPLPCADEGPCAYADGWDHANDPDDTADLLVGSYVHAHVAGVRTRFSRDAKDRVETAPRAVVLDEFPGEAFVREFDDHADDHAAWLARSLREEVEDRRDAYDADLWGDDWVRAWLDGEADEVEAVDDALGVLARTGDLLEAREGAAEVREEVDEGLLDELGVAEPLEAVAGGEDAAEAFDTLRAALDAIDPEQPGAALTNWIEPAVAEPLDRATVSGAAAPDAAAVGVDELPIAGDLAALVEDAIDAASTDDDGAEARVRAAVTALRGGREGCRRLAAWADDGYAHPDAHHLLTAVAAPSGETTDPGTRIGTSAWAFDDEATDGTTLDVVDTAGRATTALDRNGHGALLHTPPARTAAGGEDVPLVGLDATARPELWATAVGEDVTLADIHETEAERARFLEEALDLRVIQAADRPRYYSGSPGSKDTDGDVALLQRLAEEYAGIDAPRERGAEATRVGRPAAITTKDVREVLEGDDRLDDAVAAWDHYGNVKGSNHLGDHRLAAVLGCQHYGDDAVERFAALAGEEADTDRRSGRGAGLDYGSDVANAYLQHMTEDQTTQAILRFARGDSGATVVARTSALRDDLPVVGEGQVVETWNKTATAIAREYRTLGREFTTADVRDVVDVSPRQVRRVLAELAEAGYVRRVEEGEGRATTYERVDDPGAGEVDLPTRDEAVATRTTPVNEYYTWNVRVRGGDAAPTPVERPGGGEVIGAPPAPDAVDGVEPPS